MSHRPWRKTRKAQGDTDLGAVSFKGCGLAHDKCGQAGRGRGFGSPRWASRTLEYRWRWFPEVSNSRVRRGDHHYKNTREKRCLWVTVFLPTAHYILSTTPMCFRTTSDRVPGSLHQGHTGSEPLQTIYHTYKATKGSATKKPLSGIVWQSKQTNYISRFYIS